MIYYLKINNSSFKRGVLGLGKENQIEVKGILDDKDYASKVCLDIEQLYYQYTFLL